MEQFVWKNKKNVDLAVQNILKGLFSEPPMFNLNRDGLETYSKIREYLKTFNYALNLKPTNIASLKRRKLTMRTVPKSEQSDEFIKFLKIKFPNFDEESFLLFFYKRY